MSVLQNNSAFKGLEKPPNRYTSFVSSKRERTNMIEQTDQFIIDAYKKAVELKLDPEFLRLLEEELKRRNLTIHE